MSTPTGVSDLGPTPVPASGRRPSGILSRLRRWLVEPAYPHAAIEIRARSVSAVRAVREQGRWRLGAAASLALPEGALSLSMVQPNVVDPAAVRQAIGSVLERAGIAPTGVVGLVLPDPVARVSVVPWSEFADKETQEVEDLLRFRLRKAVPFEMKDARLSFAIPDVLTPEGVLVAAAIAKPVLEGYEEVLSSLGIEPGLVELCGLALLSAVEARRPPGDRLVVNWDEGYVSLVLARAGHPVLVRTLTGEVAATREDVVREVANTVLFYREKLGGAGLESVSVRSTQLPIAAAIEILREPTGLVPQVIDPWPDGAGDTSPQSQAVAGAAACVVGKTA